MIIAILKGIKPAVAGLIAAAALYIGQTALRYDPLLANQGGVVDLRSIVIAAAAFVAVGKLKVDPIKTILAAGLVGLVVFSL